MNKVYLIHGWGGDRNLPLFNYLRKELRGKVNVVAFDMPNTNIPKIGEWVDFLEKNVKDIDIETYFVGHSIGCQTILRFLEKLPKNKKIAGAVFIAGWFNLKNLSEEEKLIAESWLTKPINLDNVKQHTKNFLAIFSDNDPYVPLSDSELFKKNLNAKIIVKKNQEHFNNAEEIKEIFEFLK